MEKEYLDNLLKLAVRRLVEAGSGTVDEASIALRDEEGDMITEIRIDNKKMNSVQCVMVKLLIEDTLIKFFRSSFAPTPEYINQLRAEADNELRSLLVGTWDED